MFAQSGATKAQAIPYDWSTGIVVTSEPNVGKWYVVNLDMTHGGIFYDKEYVQAHTLDIKKVGKTAEGNTEANITVVNPLNEKVEVDITAYIADNEYNHHYSLEADETKSMNVGAGMLVKMGNYQVYLYLVMDVEITPEQAEQMEAVHVNIEEAPANSVAFVPEPFNWDNFGTNEDEADNKGNFIPANKEVWLAVDWSNNLTAGYTLKLFAKTTNGAPTTVYGGLAMDCPATSIQEQSTDLSLNEIAHKTLDLAMLDMVPGTVYVRLKANQPLHVWAAELEPVLPAEPIFTIDGATEIVKGTTYTLSASSKYFVKYNTLTAPEYYYTQIELTNNNGYEVTLQGKAAKNAQDLPDGKVYSAMSQDVTVGAGKTIKKEIDNTIMKSLVSGDQVYGLVTGGNENISFKLVEVCTEKDPCVPAEAIDVVITEAEDAQAIQAANTTKWYKVDITEAISKVADIEMTMEAEGQVTVNVDIANDCAIGEPTQSYSATEATSSYTLNYSLFKDVEKATDNHYYLYVRVNCNKEITVTGKMLTSVVYNNGWVGGNEPTIEKPARIETELIIDGTIKALGITLATGNIIIKNGGKLIVGKEGIKGSQVVGQIVIEEGGNLMIDPAATTNNKPFITAYKALDLTAETNPDAVHAGSYKHEFIALPVENRENSPVGLYYSNWTYNVGWGAVDGFRHAFVGYDVTKSTAADYCGYFAGQLAPNQNQTLSLPGRGWHAFGNSWLVPLNVLDMISGNKLGAADKAIYLYAHNPIEIAGVDYSIDHGQESKQYIPVTAAIIEEKAELAEVKPMEGFFLYTESATTAKLNYNPLYEAYKAPAAKRAEDNRNKVAVVLRGGKVSDFVYMIEGDDDIAHKMMSNGLSIYAEEGLAQVANNNLIGTTLTIQTNNNTEYTLNFTWVKGETLVLLDLENGNTIDMTADNTYTFTAEPNTVSERFQVVGRKSMPTAIENTEAIKGANKVLENGKVVIIKNGVKYNVLGAQL
jgi:hypothetical protein